MSIDELEALEQAANVAPWTAREHEGVCQITTPRGWALEDNMRDDYALTAAARNALPALLRIARAALALDMSAEVEGCIYSGDGACPGCDVCNLHGALAALR